MKINKAHNHTKREKQMELDTFVLQTLQNLAVISGDNLWTPRILPYQYTEQNRPIVPGHLKSRFRQTATFVYQQ